MTIHKGSILFDDTNLKCDLCGSDNIVNENQGYVCRDCGVVLNIQKLQYNRPYNHDFVHHSIYLGTTHIGTKRERREHPKSHVLRRLSIFNSRLSTKKYSEDFAFKEISRILDCLSLPRTCESRVRDKFREIFPQLQPGTRYKNPEKLAAIIIYIVLKLENIAIRKEDIVNTSQLSKEEFNTFMLQVQRFIPEYARRNRQRYVSQKILKITEHFELDMSFYFLSHKILLQLWENIKNSTDDVIAGLCTSVTALCNYKNEISVSSVCKLLNIRMSTIQFQVKTRIFERFRLPGFVSLVRSADLLKRFMEKIGVIEGEHLDVEIIPEESEDTAENVVSVRLGGGCRIFDPQNERYLMGVLDDNNSVHDNKAIIFCYLDVYRSYNQTNSTKKVKDTSGVLCDLTTGKYYPKKGPPMVGIT